MLVAGYEHQFSESLRYWRTRFVVLPADVPPASAVMPQGERLDDEEIRLLGMDKLAEMFAAARWRGGVAPGERERSVRFLPTDLDPTAMVLDDDLMAQLGQLHAAGPLQRKIQDRYIGELSLASVAKAMREDGGVAVKEHRWHGRRYMNAFAGWDFVSWLCREFTDVPTREEGAKWGVKLQEAGLFEHCRGLHGFLDGYVFLCATTYHLLLTLGTRHYYYQLKGEYAVPSTPRTSWFGRTSRQVSDDHTSMGFSSPRKPRKHLILSQSMIIDVDRHKVRTHAPLTIRSPERAHRGRRRRKP
jgi:hypothetical protein